MALKSIPEHFLVPKHEIVPEERIEEVLKKFGVESDKLPRILKSDPIIKEIGAKKGDLLKITRTSRLAGECIYFRLVV